MTTDASLRGVSKNYGSTMALHPTDLELRPGVTGLLGPNGAGKSTLIPLLATAQPPSSGHHHRGRARGDRRPSPSAPRRAAGSATSRRRSASRGA